MTSYNADLATFQSTLPVWGATCPGALDIWTGKFQSTLPVWGATSLRLRLRHLLRPVSIHAPRVGSDAHNGLLYWRGDSGVSIHAPRVGSDDLPSARRVK